MGFRTLTLAAVGLGLTLGTTTPSFADWDGWGHNDWRRHEAMERARREHEWREQRWREHAWREHEWREHAWRYQPPPAYAPGYAVVPAYPRY